MDIDAGTGFLTVELAQRSGAARVVAVDPWADAMEVLRRKVDRLKLANVELMVSDAENLDLPDESVDVVVSNLGVNNFDNAEFVLRECLRVLRPTGRLLISTNLVGHMAEFYDAYRHVLTAMDLHQHIPALDAHINHCPCRLGSRAQPPRRGARPVAHHPDGLLRRREGLNSGPAATTRRPF
ncbi:MAG: arsenite methyltransferase [Kribbellaceae bacterium]|nr:arsenite methyltransferase [Kribbellaceae bacterium]